MATATIVSGTQPTTIDEGNAITNWGGDTFALNTSAGINGTCVECIQTTNGNNDVYVTGSWDFSGTGIGDQHLRLWFNLTYFENLSSTNPIQVFLYDGTNTAYYYWTPGTSYQGGWSQAIIYTGATPDSGTVNKANITRIGMRMVTSSKPRNAPFNALYDAWRYGDGYSITGGTNGDEIDWSHIATIDAASAYGIVTEENGIYTLRGDIQIGDGVSTTYFKPEGQLVVFQEEQVLSTLYKLSFFDDASNLTNIDYVGGAISSGSIATGGTLRFDLDANLTDFNAFSMDGVQISGADASTFPNSSSFNVTGCVFDDCNQIDPQLCVFTGHTIKNSTDSGGACLYPSNDANFSNILFQNCNNCIEYDATSDNTFPSFDDIVFDDVSGKYDVNNTSGSSVSISNTGTSNGNSYNTSGSVVTFVNSVTVTVTVVNENNVAIEGAVVYLKTVGGTVVLNGVTNSSGVITGTYGGTTPASIDATVSGVKYGSSSTPYEYYTLVGSIATGTGYSQTAQLSID